MEILKHSNTRQSYPTFTYTGDWRIQYNNPHWHLYLLSSGTLKFFSNTHVDAFIVGGGEGGMWFGAGGYGGECVTVRDYMAMLGKSYSIVVGAGGKIQQTGGYNPENPAWYGGASSAFGTTAAGGASSYVTAKTKGTGTAYGGMYYYHIARTKVSGSNAGGYSCKGTWTESNPTVGSFPEGEWGSYRADGELGDTYAFGETTYPRFAPGGGGAKTYYYYDSSYDNMKASDCIGHSGGGICGADTGVFFHDTYGGNDMDKWRLYDISYETVPKNIGAGGPGGYDWNFGTPGGSGIVILRDAR